MKGNDWKDRLNIVYSTNRDFEYESYNEEEEETLPKEQQKLRVSIESQFNADENRCSSPGAEGRRREGTSSRRVSS